MRLSVSKALQDLAEHADALFLKVMEHGTMSVEIYRPVKTDRQTPHLKDELYMVISGNGDFLNNGERVPFREGDVLFAAAGTEHRFENFTGDFATWVIFYGKTLNLDQIPVPEPNFIRLYLAIFHQVEGNTSCRLTGFRNRCSTITSICLNKLS
jgi:hypothetical protein